MSGKEITEWLLEGDVSIQFQVHRDLLNTERKDLQVRIATEGWGAQYLSRRRSDRKRVLLRTGVLILVQCFSLLPRG